MIRKRSPTLLLQAVAMRQAGQSLGAIAAHFQISKSTARQWTDQGYYKRHIQHALNWQRTNSDIVSARAAKYQASKSRAKKDRDCQRARHDYVSDPAWHARFRILTAKYRDSAQNFLAGKLYMALLGHCSRAPAVFGPLMEAVTGMDRAQYTAKFSSGHDCAVLLSAFDLTNPEHLVRAMFLANIGQVCQDQPADIMSLPWIGSQHALDLASVFISRELSRFGTSKADEGTAGWSSGSASVAPAAGLRN